jgi:hypothetical protein
MTLRERLWYEKLQMFNITMLIMWNLLWGFVAIAGVI